MDDRRRIALRRRAHLTTAATLVVALLSATPALAASPGKNAWYWPTGHDISSSGGSWLQYRTWYSDAPAWHLAYDDCDPYRTQVPAATYGEVLEARTDVGGYGPDGTDGGAVVVLYKNAKGEEFKALYGHVQELKVSKGAKVVPGQILCVLNNYDPPHVHFAIHPGRTYPSSTTSKYYVGMMMGHTHDYTVVNGSKVPVTYGFVDPIAYLNNNRPYSPPPATLTTPSVPAVARANRVFTSYGYLTPRHLRGTRPVTIEVWRQQGSSWTLVRSVRAIGWDSGTRTRWEAQIRLETRGNWRIRAHITADSEHTAAYSGWRDIAVR